jgi:hypothetical protein
MIETEMPRVEELLDVAPYRVAGPGIAAGDLATL